MNGLRKNRTWAGVLDLPQNPDFSGNTCFPDVLIRMSGKSPASRTCRFACQGNRQLPGLADSPVRETVSFPDLLIRMSGKPSASRTCWFACQGNHQLPGLPDSHVRETVSFPDFLIRMSGKPTASPTC